MTKLKIELLRTPDAFKILETIKDFLKGKNKDGDDFNIFKVINAVSYETMVHSAFIAELLNPKGSHGQGDLFLKEFLPIISIKEENFSTAKAFVKTEYHIGFTSSEEPVGGRIDILIRDKNDNIIAIENKIYASDQKWQLLRYYNNFPDKNKLHLLYLTLDGSEPSTDSIYCKNEKQSDNLTYRISKEENHFKTISYEKEILKWLENCIKNTKINDKIYLICAIQQYIEIVKTLTHQSRNLIMRKKLVDEILKSPEDLKAVFELSNNLLPLIKAKIQWLFWETLMEKFEKQVQKLSKPVYENDVCDYYEKNMKYVQMNTAIYKQEEYSIFWKAEIFNNFYIGFHGEDSCGKLKPLNVLNKNLYDFLISSGYKDYNEKDNGVFRYVYGDKNMTQNELNFYSFDSETIIGLIDEEQRNILVNSIVEIAKNEIKGVVNFLKNQTL